MLRGVVFDKLQPYIFFGARSSDIEKELEPIIKFPRAQEMLTYILCAYIQVGVQSED